MDLKKQGASPTFWIIMSCPCWNIPAYLWDFIFRKVIHSTCWYAPIKANYHFVDINKHIADVSKMIFKNYFFIFLSLFPFHIQPIAIPAITEKNTIPKVVNPDISSPPSWHSSLFQFFILIFLHTCIIIKLSIIIYNYK